MARGRRKVERFTVNDVNPQMSLMPEHDWDFVKTAVERVKTAWELHHMMNPDGKPMLMAYSGGKDSTCLFFVCKQAAEELGVPMEQMFHVQYNVTNVDPPDLFYFIRDVMKKQYRFIEIHHPKKTMWQLIVERQLPPTQKVRYCCSELKESSNVKGGYSLTGVRRAESHKRATREAFEKLGNTRKDSIGTTHILLNDNTEDRRWTEFCMQKNAYVCNPLIDWSDEQVWKYIKGFNLPYCKLYDEGWQRLGCILCPMASKREREKECECYPGFKKQYIRTFQKMLERWPRYGWKTGEEVFEWWMNFDYSKTKGQDEKLFEEEDNGFGQD